MGEADYRFEREKAGGDGHELIEHETLIGELKRAARDEHHAERLRAVQAIRYASRRKEGLVEWTFDTTGVARKDLINWAKTQVRPFFTRL